MSDKLDRFIDLMKGIFELDKSDLDFGIYRIMNIRRSEIEKFLTEGLPKKVQETLEPFASNTSEIEKRIAEIEKTCDEVGIDVTASKMADEYKQLKTQLTAGVDISALESDVYSALYSFFNRYYDEGDFISKRRYKEGVYAIPYEGEEVKLYWANQDQYYIKTTENFKDYTFIDNGRTVHFRLVDATTEQDNNKESDDSKRVFMLYKENDERPELKTMEVIDGELYIRFVYDIPEDKKKKYAEENYAKISTAITSQFKDWFELLRPAATASPKKPKTVLEKHLEAYVAKNTFDYFIHKDLRGFLNRELDFYIKSEIIHLDDLDTTNEKRVDTWLAKVKAIKRVGKTIIDFLAQIEDFQKKLWLKKKFVVETNWCITLDKIDESFYPEIIANKAQVQEWIGMYAINEIEGNLDIVSFSDPMTVDFLRQNKNLIVDTKHFTTDFKDRLIATIDNLDEQTNGLLIKSENFQALGLLKSKLSGKVKCCYYDPPYNTSENSFLYKNGYKDASWASMIADRILLTKCFLKEKGVICTAIDDNEHPLLEYICDQCLGIDSRLGNLIVEIKPSGRTNDNFLATSHEYIVFYGLNPQETDICFFSLTEEQLSQYKESDEQGTHKWRDFMRTGGFSTPEERPNSFYPIYYNAQTGDITLDKITGYTEILPIDTAGKYRVWRKTRPSFLNHLKNHEIKVVNKRNSDEYKVQIIDRIKSGVRPKSVWIGSRYDAATHGTKWIKNIFGESSPFSFPKSVYAVYDTLYTIIGEDPDCIVMDIFAGSATTGEAVIRLNKESNDEQTGNRKYVMVEMGIYFNTVTIPRMKKILYSEDWKDGKPVNRNTGVSQIMKYITLESYEDALSNIELSEKKHRLSSLLGDDYLINYMLDVEAEGSLLDLDRFNAPFTYKLKINEHNETKEKVIDLAETFNYLLGLTVVSQSTVAYFKSEPDSDGSYEGAVRLINNIDGEYAFKQIEGRLPDGGRCLIIWRTITDDLVASNAALDAYFNKHRINPSDREFDIIYVNGDNNLENQKSDEENWKVRMIEPEFKKRMFEEA